MFLFQNQQGFSLIEVMLTMSLFAIVSLFASPFYGDFIYKQEVAVTSAGLRGSLTKAQINSMQSKNASSWGVQVSNGNIILFRGDSFGGRDQNFDEVLAIHPKITVSGLGDGVVFARTTGRPTSTPTLSVSGNEASETFRINSEGVWEEQE